MSGKCDIESNRQQAEYWFARLRADDCSSAEHRDFDAWLAADAEHTSAYVQVEHLWNELDGLAEDQDIQCAHRAARYSVRISARGIGRRRLLIVVSFGVMLAVGWLAFFFWSFTPAQRYVTGHNEQRTVVLADGSRLMLNSDTTLEVRLKGDLRSAHLLRGEALFEVVHDARRPFVVKSNGNSVVDLGTRFDVRNSGDRTLVTVLQGAVSVERDNRVLRLGPGEQAIAGRGMWHRDIVDPEMVASWTHGRLIFRATPLGEAVAEANRYGQTRLVVADPRLNQLRISGDFRIGRTQALVRALESAFPIRAETDPSSDTVRLYRR